MTDDASRAEFLSLVGELGNQLTYLRELGVEGIEAGDAGAVHAETARDEAAQTRKASAPTAARESALRRNAEAELRETPAEVKPSRAVSRPAPPANLSQRATESNEMA
ncbi:MAG: hypothetical protein QOF61_2102, partial [Acidobacteriota bacterium]|nr:hypothetical protein [Acidobacteriota bacterium]